MRVASATESRMGAIGRDGAPAPGLRPVPRGGRCCRVPRPGHLRPHQRPALAVNVAAAMHAALDEDRWLNGTFAAAARRRFSPTWTSADIVRLVADFRSSSAAAASLISASAAENQLRGVLGEKLTTRPDEETRGRAQLILLATLTAGLTPHELDGLLSEGRTLADSPAAAGH